MKPPLIDPAVYPEPLRDHLPSKCEQVWIAECGSLARLRIESGACVLPTQPHVAVLTAWVAEHLERAKLAPTMCRQELGVNCLYWDWAEGTIFSVDTGDQYFVIGLLHEGVHCDWCDGGNWWGARNHFNTTWICHICYREMMG